MVSWSFSRVFMALLTSALGGKFNRKQPQRQSQRQRSKTPVITFSTANPPDFDKRAGQELMLELVRVLDLKD